MKSIDEIVFETAAELVKCCANSEIGTAQHRGRALTTFDEIAVRNLERALKALDYEVEVVYERSNFTLTATK